MIKRHSSRLAFGSLKILLSFMISSPSPLTQPPNCAGHLIRKLVEAKKRPLHSLSATGSAWVIAEGELGKFVEEVLNAKFSRNDESGADEYGFRLMLKHNYDYHAMRTAFLKLGALAGDKVDRSLKATHPAPNERAEEAKKWAGEEDEKRAAERATDPAASDVPPEPASDQAPEQASEPAPETRPEAPSE